MARERSADDGFTLIELLVVMIVIGILAAIAIPLYLNQQKKAYDTTAEADMHSAIVVLEDCKSGDGSYPSYGIMGNSMAGAAFDPCSTTFTPSAARTWTIYYPNTTSGSASSYVLYTYVPQGNSNYYWCFASYSGGSIVKRTGITPTSYEQAC